MGQNLTFGAWEGKTDRKLDLGDCVVLQDAKLPNGLSCFLTDCFGNLERKREKKTTSRRPIYSRNVWNRDQNILNLRIYSDENWVLEFRDRGKASDRLIQWLYRALRRNQSPKKEKLHSQKMKQRFLLEYTKKLDSLLSLNLIK